jgi:long-chain acyl-CoA synthetase
MLRQSILEYFQAGSRPGDEMAVVWRRGYKIERWKYKQLLACAAWFANELDGRGINRGEHVLIWGENSGEWIAAFLGCAARGVVAVPMDAIASADFAGRVAAEVKARLVVASRENVINEVPALYFDEFRSGASTAEWQPLETKRSETVEIIFTSGTTAEPRGVVLTHGNLLANLEPIECEFQKHKRYEHYVHPLRILDLVPLSHIFGQIMGVFIPQIFGATVSFMDSLRPPEVAGVIRSEKINVLVTVPRVAESLQDKIERDFEFDGKSADFRERFRRAEGQHFLRRWWMFRKIHRQFGWRFWAIVSGGAALSKDVEQFWGRLGYAVIQGYGLTETTATVSLNHPFKLTKGSIGKAMPGMDVKLSQTGEILVRGENVAAGYFQNGNVAPVLDEEGWFHTGDLGERDENGALFFKGRSKNVIVTPEGMNIYPGDLEAALRAQAEVKDCVVVGLERDGNAEACAVLILREPTADAPGVVGRANQSLAQYQQIRQWRVWPEADFPRTPTQKPLIGEIRKKLETGASARSTGLREWISNWQNGGERDILQASNLEADLNLSSMDRVDLLAYLEDRYQVEIDETQFAKATTVSDLEALLRQPAQVEPDFPFVLWPRRWPITWIRDGAFYLLVCPAALILGWPRVRGNENLRRLNGPALFVCNHVTTIDLGILLPALSADVRRRLTVGMGGERLRSMRHPPREQNFFWKIYQQTQYGLLAALMNIFPLPQRSAVRETFSFVGELIDAGWNVLIFPEGALTQDGKLLPFRTGIGVLASQLNVPVVPLRIDGLYELREAGKIFVGSGKIRISVGEPIQFGRDTSPEEIAAALQKEVEMLGESSQ